MDERLGAPPKRGWAKMVPELHVTGIEESLSFWRGVLGFAVAYQRPEERFVYLERPEGAQIMLCQRHGRFETGRMEPPFGRGVMLQLYVDSIDPILSSLSSARWPIYLGPRDVWRRVGDHESGQREVFVQDPDGYLVMIAHHIGERAVETPR